MDDTPIIMRRVLRAAPDKVFKALIDPASMRLWLCPKDFLSPEVETDPRVGGAFRIVMRGPDGTTRYPAAGHYQTVRAPELLEFSWMWQPEHPMAGVETSIRITLTPQGSDTLLVMEHFGLPTEEERVGHHSGWTSIIDKLEKLFLEEKAS